MNFDLRNSQYRARQVTPKTQEVANYHFDNSKPGRPLHLLVPGGLVALASLAVIIYIVYTTWYLHQLTVENASIFLAILSPIYIGGVFTFSYGYELYDLKRALRLTIIIVIITIAILIVGASLLSLAGGALRGGSSKKSSSSSRSSSGGSHGSVVSSGRSSSSSSHSHSSSHGSAFRKVTAQPIVCPFCGHSYIASQFNHICPNCGSPLPR
jgi:uncharacterized membrane protein YgcG